MDQSRVGGNGVALLDKDDVARDDLGGGNALPRAVSHDRRVRRRYSPEGGHGLFRP